MKIVSNTGPIIGLAKIGKIHLLKSMVKEVLIPPFVKKELFGKIGDESEQIESALKDFIKVQDLTPLDSAVDRIILGLDEGEKQSVGLASTLENDILLLLDDRAGRQIAEKLKIPTIGIIGLLLIAKEKSLIGNVGSLIEELRNKGYWLSDEIMEVARQIAGE